MSSALHLREHLFPHLPPVTEAVLFSGLPGALPLPEEPSSWLAETESLIQSRLASLGLQVAADQELVLHPSCQSALYSQARNESIKILGLEGLATRMSAALTAEGITALVIKGPSLTKSCPALALRTFTDLDLLVHPRDFPRARVLLMDSGFRDINLEPRSSFTYKVREGVNMSRGGLSVDLHHHIPPWLWGTRIPFQDLTDRSTECVPGTRCVDIIDNLLIEALHLVSHMGAFGPRLQIWRDIAVIAQNVAPHHVVERATKYGLAWWLKEALLALPEAVRPAELLALLSDAAPRIGERFRLRRLTPPSFGSRHQVGIVFRIPLGSALHFLAGYAFPSRSFLSIRIGKVSYTKWWASHVKKLVARNQRATRPSSGQSPY